MLEMKDFLAVRKAFDRGLGRKPAGKSPLLLHLSALLLFSICFVFTLLVAFPTDQLRDYAVAVINRQTGQRIGIGELSLSPLLTVKARDISWQPQKKDWPPVAIDRLSISPSLTSLFGKNPAGSFHGLIAGGTADGWCRKNGSFKAELDGIDIGPFVPESVLFPPSGKISGTVAADRTAGSGPGITELDLKAEDLRLAGLEAFGLAKGGLALGRLTLRGKMTGMNFVIEQLQNEGGDLAVVAHGSVLVNERPELCRLNLQIEMRPGPSLAATLQDLFSLGGIKAGTDGSYKFRLMGSLARPVLR